MVRGTPSHCNQVLPPGPQAAPAQTCRQRHEHRRRILIIESHHESMQVVNLAMHASRRRRFEGFHPARSCACVPIKERSETKVRRCKPRVNPDRDQATTRAAEITEACLRSSPPCSPCSKPLKSSQPEPPTLISRTKCPRQTNSIFRRPNRRGHPTFLYIRRQSSRQSTSQSQTKTTCRRPSAKRSKPLQALQQSKASVREANRRQFTKETDVPLKACNQPVPMRPQSRCRQSQLPRIADTNPKHPPGSGGRAALAVPTQRQAEARLPNRDGGHNRDPRLG